jgi:hypothetical protein
MLLYDERLGGFQNFKCEVLDTILCDKETSKKFENFYIIKEQPQLNTNLSFATDEEKKQYLKEYKKRRNLVNPDYKKMKIELVMRETKNTTID